MWAVVDADGELIATYTREAAAELNKKDGTVVPAPPSPHMVWNGEEWEPRAEPRDPMAGVRATWDRTRYRQLGYAETIEMNEQFEVSSEVIIALYDAGALSTLPQKTLDRIVSLKAKIAAVKAQYP